MPADFSYTHDGYWHRLLPNNAQAENVWREIAGHFEGGVIPLSAWPGVYAQIRAAGYTIRKGTAPALSRVSDEDLMRELSE